MKPIAYKCTTCQVIFPASEDLKTHHKSNWHRYNLKRKSDISQLPPVTYEAFQRKLELLASADKVIKKGDAHLKQRSAVAVSPVIRSTVDEVSDPTTDKQPVLEHLKLAYPSICHSLFDNSVSQTIDENISYMERSFSFFIPDEKYLKDKEGLIQYLGTKLYDSHRCLFCNRPFRSLRAVRSHMKTKGHTTIGIGTEEQEDELENFYDYSESYNELIPAQLKEETSLAMADADDAWSDDEESEDVEDFIARQGLEGPRINEYGNLVIPGRGEAAHRSVAYVYYQRLPMSSYYEQAMHKLVKSISASTQRGDGRITQIERQLRQDQRWNIRKHERQNLRVSMKGNKLNRTMKTAEKYFI